MPEPTVPPSVAERLYRETSASRWRVTLSRFTLALEASLHKAFADHTPADPEAERYLGTVHVADLALACACADGDDEAWEHFVREYRPALYRAAESVTGGRGARELADSIYAELFGLSGVGETRRSLLLYFHGRSSLASWLRAVLAQRHVDRLRRERRLEPLDADDDRVVASAAPDPERPRWLALMTDALEVVIGRLPARDRLRLACYYGQSMTLAQVGVALGEHEATVSRKLARTRRALRLDLEQQLRETQGLSEAAVGQCFESVMRDAGTIDLADLFGQIHERKESALERSK